MRVSPEDEGVRGVENRKAHPKGATMRVPPEDEGGRRIGRKARRLRHDDAGFADMADIRLHRETAPKAVRVRSKPFWSKIDTPSRA